MKKEQMFVFLNGGGILMTKEDYIKQISDMLNQIDDMSMLRKLYLIVIVMIQGG